MNFVGEYTVKCDAKGRMALPSALRQVLETAGLASESMVIRKDLFEQCLTIKPMQTWQNELSQLKAKVNPYNKQQMQFLRGVQTGTAEVTLDAQGRILIPKRLTDVAAIESDVTLIGLGDYIEVWSSSVLQNSQMSDEDLAQMAGDLFGGSSYVN